MSKYLFPLLLLMITGLELEAQTIEKVEPPFWWEGMHNTSLQLMVHGKDIGSLVAHASDKLLKVTKTHKTDSPNYLFVDLELDPSITEGTYKIQFNDGDRLSVEINYELKKRNQNSSERKGFDNSDVLYLITPDRFANGDTTNDEITGMREGLNRSKPFGRHGGDIKGISDHLDYIKDMGFTAIWLNPILENDQANWSYHGYSTTDYYKVDPRFGSNEAYVKLSHDAKEMGVGMIMDIIVNHCGSEHWWMKDPPFRDWINYQGKAYQQTNHRKETLLDPHKSDMDRKVMTEGWFVPTMPDLNQRNSFMSKYLIQNSIWWIEYAELAGIRQDTYSYPFRDFMTDWTCAIKAEYPDFNIVGEEWVDDPAMISYWQEGKINRDGYTSCLPSLMDFPMTFSLHKALTEEESFNEGIIRLYQNLSRDYHYADPNALVIFPDNHDMSRILTQLNENADLVKMALGYILTTRGTPQIYYGTEILMSNKGTDSHGVIRSDFPGGWIGDDKNGFESIGLTEEERSMQKWIQHLLKWRQQNPIIHYGKLMHYIPEDGIYVYFRYDKSESVMVIMNNNKEAKSINLDRFEERLAGYSSGHNILYNANEYLDLSESINLDSKSIKILKLLK